MGGHDSRRDQIGWKKVSSYCEMVSTPFQRERFAMALNMYFTNGFSSRQWLRAAWEVRIETIEPGG